MMPSVVVQCPYCGETIELLVEDSAELQEYIEDCQVCCRPISVRAVLEDGALQVRVSAEND